jgi:hypothetical protein
MRAEMKTTPSVALNRVLDGLEHEIIEASDEEILAAARELGMDLRMRESAAFAGVKYPSRPQLSDFFDMEGVREIQEQAQRTMESSAGEKPRAGRQKLRGKRRDTKRPDGS